MSNRLFIIGATGYIGGDFLFALKQVHADWSIACLVRDDAKASRITTDFPDVEIVRGDLESADIIEEEASKAGIVYDMANCDHVSSATAIARGLDRNPAKTVFWIHTSGTGTLTHANFASKSFGETLPTDSKVYDDWEGVGEITTLPDYAIHRNVDKIVLAASSKDPARIKTAIVFPSCIYGVGRGTGNKTSKQVYIAAQVALSAGKGIQVGHGVNHWDEVHIRDLSDLYVSLGEAAMAGGSPATWNEEGIYIVESGSFTWGGVIHQITEEAHKQGYLTAATVAHVGAEESKTYHSWYPYICATTSRGVSKRAKHLLGWNPSQKSLHDEIPDIVRQEAISLGLSGTD